MAKKHRMGKGTGGPSKGIHSNVARNTLRDMRQSYTGTMAQLANKAKAWREGKRVMITIPNPEIKDASGSNRPFIRVEARTVWGDPNPPKKKAKSNS